MRLDNSLLEKGLLAALLVVTALFHLLLLFSSLQRYTYRVLQTIQVNRILLCVWAEPAILGSTKTALKFKYEN